MKKIPLLLLSAFCFFNVSNAQETKSDLRERLLFGLKAGGNISNVYDKNGDSFNTNPKFGMAAGTFLMIPIGKYLGVQPEVLLSQRGFKATGRILGSTYEFTRTTYHLDIPLLFELKPIEFITIVLGPQYSYLIKQKDVFANAATTIAQEQEFENENIRKNTLCFTGGMDININHFVLGIRAGWDIQNNNGDGTSSTPRYKNAWYQGTLGYRFYSK